MSDEKKTRAVVSNEDFVRVVLDRETYDTAEKAAKAVGLKIASFTQRIVRERKAFPKLWEAVPVYVNPKAVRRPSAEQMEAIFAKFAPKTAE